MEQLFNIYLSFMLALEVAYGLIKVFDRQSLPYSPLKIYKNSNLNFPSCLVFAIGIWALFPISSIWHFINWIIRVGRK